MSCWTGCQTGGLTRLGVAQNRGAAAEGGAAAVVAAAAAAAAQAAAPDAHHHPDLLGRTHWRQRHDTGGRRRRGWGGQHRGRGVTII